MKLLLLGGTDATRELLKKLIGTTRHTLHWHRPFDHETPAPGRYDLVLVDDSPGSCTENASLLDLLQHIRNRTPQVPILVLSPVRAAAAGGVLPSCGVSRSSDGVAHVHCRLRELAWSETAGLLRAALERPAREPIVFVYQG